MNSIILCEGFDDAYILGYYLYKTTGWMRTDKPNFSENYQFPKVNRRNQGIEYYDKGSDKLAIWSVGGKDSYDKPLKFIASINTEHPDVGIANIIILSDRDDMSVQEQLVNITNSFIKNGIDVQELANHTATTYFYSIEGEDYKLNIVPIVIPFDVEGALETVLMNAIEESTDEEHFIVSQARTYVDNVKKSELVISYLQKSRLELKAKFSAVISITNPDRSTAVFNALLTSHDWEKAESVKRHFGVLNRYI